MKTVFYPVVLACTVGLAALQTGCGSSPSRSVAASAAGDTVGGIDAAPNAAAATASPVTAAPGVAIPAVEGLPPTSANAGLYRIGTDDLVSVAVFQVPELSSKERVDSSGSIALPLVGAVEVAGLTPNEAEAKIAEVLGRDYLQNPQVDVFVEEYASRRITVNGSVASPGVFPVSGPTTLMQILAVAGGLTELANPDEIIIFREGEDGRLGAYIVNFDAISQGKIQDPLVAGNDRIFVPQSGSAVFFDRLTNMLRLPAIPVW